MIYFKQKWQKIETKTGKPLGQGLAPLFSLFNIQNVPLIFSSKRIIGKTTSITSIFVYSLLNKRSLAFVNGRHNN